MPFVEEHKGFPGFIGLPLAGLSRPSQAEPVGLTTASQFREFTQAICQGDEQAFNRFYDLYSLRLYKYLLVLAHGNESEAREALQTVVVKLARSFKVFDQEFRLWGWLCRVARNAYVDLCRARQRDQRFVPLDDCVADIAEPRRADHRLSAALQGALQVLTAEELELMRAAYVDERPLQELADASGHTYKALESKLARLRRKLKNNLLHQLTLEESR